jgi:hypothetical protein
MRSKNSITFYSKLFALVFISLICSCDLFDLTPDEQIEVKFEMLPGSGEVLIEDFQFSVTDITLGFNSFYDYSIEHSDSVFIFDLQLDSTLYIEDGLIEARNYKYLKLGLKETPELPIQPMEEHNSIFVSGSYQGNDFTILLDSDSSITFNFGKPLDFRDVEDTLTSLSIYIDTDSWFSPKPNQFLDPTDITNHEKIKENILNSFSLEKLEDCKNPKKCDGSSEDLMPEIILTDTSSLEASGTMDFRIELSSPSLDSVVVYYETVNRAAKADSDFIFASDSIVFKPQETRSFISVLIIDDDKKESNEKFGLSLLSSKNATINNSNKTVVGTILNDDN